MKGPVKVWKQDGDENTLRYRATYRTWQKREVRKTTLHLLHNTFLQLM